MIRCRAPGARRHAAAPLLLALVVGVVPAPAGATGIESLAWLAGCWKTDGGEPGSGEQWTPLAGGSLLDTSRTVRGGRTIAWEFMRIAATADGTPAFHAQPSNQPAATFTAIHVSADEVVFENLGKDFPQRVVYRLAAPGQLAASIEGQHNGAPRSVAFPMTRVSCDALAQSR